MKDRLVIRAVKNADKDFLVKGNDEIKRVEKQSKSDNDNLIRLFKALKKKNIKILEKNNKIVGFIAYDLNHKLMFYSKPAFWILEIYITKTERQKGYTKLLYKHVYKIAKEKGYKNIYCDAYAVNKDAITFHKLNNFRPVYTVYEKKI